MEDCKPMSTPIVTNWKKLHASEGELVDPTVIPKVEPRLQGFKLKEIFFKNINQ